MLYSVGWVVMRGDSDGDVRVVAQDGGGDWVAADGGNVWASLARARVPAGSSISLPLRK